jgi:hypothetical protein
MGKRSELAIQARPQRAAQTLDQWAAPRPFEADYLEAAHFLETDACLVGLVVQAHIRNVRLVAGMDQ